jgi:metal-responsive CopG/Arc/MetJ family transcriptional regulator
MEQPPRSIYLPVRLPKRAVEKLDKFAAARLCATRSEAIRRLIDEARTDEERAA